MADSESRRWRLCEDMPTTKGAAFVEWLKVMLDAAGGEGDEDASWAQTFLGTDRRVGLSAAEQRRRVVRNRKAVAVTRSMKATQCMQRWLECRRRDASHHRGC